MKKNLMITMSLLMVLGITACGNTNNNIETPEINAEPISEQGDADADADYQDPLPAEEDDGLDGPADITKEQALDAIKNYCISQQPELEEMAQSGDYTIYWDVESYSDDEIVVLYRSYTGAEVRYYVDPVSGDTYVTEFVSGIMDEEEKTGEEFNLRVYMGDGDVAVAAYSDDSLMNYIWSTSSMITDAYGNARPEWEVRFAEDAIEYGYTENGQFFLDHSDKICSIEQYSEHGFIVRAQTASGIMYTYKTAENDETILEYYETWDETKYGDTFSGSASLFR